MVYRQKKQLRVLARYMDETNPMMASAWQTKDLVAGVADDRKLEVLDQGFIRLRDQLSAWVSEGFRVCAAVTNDRAVAEQWIREYLEPRLGQQIRGQGLAAPWDSPSAPAHPVIGWWTAEASAGEGYQIFAHISDEPRTIDAAMLAEIDASSAEQWIAPEWLWRISDFYGKPEVAAPKPHSRADTGREMVYIHWQLTSLSDLGSNAVSLSPLDYIVAQSRKLSRWKNQHSTQFHFGVMSP